MKRRKQYGLLCKNVKNNGAKVYLAFLRVSPRNVCATNIGLDVFYEELHKTYFCYHACSCLACGEINAISMKNFITAMARRDSTLALDERALHRQFTRAAAKYDSASLLQQKIADELIDRIELVSPDPDTLLDLGSGTGYLGRRANEKFPALSVIAIDWVAAMANETSSAEPGTRTVIAAAEKLALGSETVPLVLSNLLLHWCDVGAVFLEVARVLEIGGTFLFSTFGPDTLKELRAAWAEVDDYPHVHEFIDMHDMGDALVAAGFSEPVLDTDRVSVTYKDVSQLVNELRCVGGANARLDRRRTCTGKERYRRFADAYEAFRVEGRLASTWEVIYGLATKDRATADQSIPVVTRPGGN
jgi:malonyl-CoA O-methyltransferase